MNSHRPFLPPESSRPRPAVHLLRLGFGAMNATDAEGIEATVRRLYGDDAATQHLLALTRGVSDPLSTESSGAALVAAAATPDYVAFIEPVSAAARLIGAGFQVDLTGRHSATLPARQSPATASAFVAEGAPIPVKRLPLAPVTLGPLAKMAAIVSMTAELANSAAGESTFKALLSEAASLSLDAAMFSATAADETQPGGLLAGVTPLAAAAGGDEAAMLADLGNVAAAVLAAGGVSVVFVCGPVTAFKLNLRLAEKGLTIWASAAVSEGVLIGIDPNAFASSIDPVPRFDVSDQAVLHMEDTVPTALSAQSGAPPYGVAGPSRSLFQTDTIALRLTLRAAWVMRAPAVAYVAAAAWA